MNKIWNEWNMEQCLSSKQLFTIVKMIAKDKPADQYHSSVIQSIGSIFYFFASMAQRNSKNGAPCTPFDKFRLIPCINYLALSNWIIEQQFFTLFIDVFHKIDFQSSKVQSIDESDLIEVFTFDFKLRINETFTPTVWIEDNLKDLLRYHSHMIQPTLQFLLDHRNYDTTAKLNPWKRLLRDQKCWFLFQSLYQTNFEEWNTFIASLRQCVVNFAEISDMLLQGFQSQQIHTGADIHVSVFFFFLFVFGKNKQIVDSIIINRWTDGNSIAKTIGSFHKKIESQRLAAIVKWIWTKKGANTSASGESETLTVSILDQLSKNETNRRHWVDLLADPNVDSANPVLQKLLRESFRNWLNTKEEAPFHSKVIELLSLSTFQNFDSRHLWKKVIDRMKNIPKIEALNEENMGSVSEKLCQNLGYCFKCWLWFEQDNPMRVPLFTFFKNVLTSLITNEQLLSIHACDYLTEHLGDIQRLDSFSHPTNLAQLIERLENTLEEYKQFFDLIDIFKQINFFKLSYAQELQLLREHEQSMKIVLDRNKSSIFHKIWRIYHKKYESAALQTSLLIFDKVFRDANQKWENFKLLQDNVYVLLYTNKIAQDLQNGTIRYEDLELMLTRGQIETNEMIKCLENEIQYLFPDLDDEKRRSVVRDVGGKIKKKMDLKEQLQSWRVLKEVTERVKEYHPGKDKIKEDDRWKEYVEALAQMEIITNGKKDISINEASRYYDACFNCVGEGAKACMEAGLFAVLNHCENEIKILASNANFTNKEKFEETLRALGESSHRGLENLAHCLERVNQVMQSKLWQYQLENMTNLSRAILSLYSNSQEFVDMLKKCCDVNLVRIPSLVNEDDKVRTEKSLEQLKEAMVYGQWKFGVCEDILQGDKNNELILKITANTIWHYNEIGENIVVYYLGWTKKN
ncbi:hypothetical protein RFI_38945 [Reticulomyxa filosa]|uniref:Uncharacterized protein n=1 Tax=Reticulomyxa filosa TaxID=46433 RepID=X6LB03_RETFI|nr:hypothetical protein RFI_38945 [Reticulomyxa filosa]|eukprot:ETN98550.1 hypothetical protein RFI_38945 [Reticulomyxa filosa]